MCNGFRIKHFYTGKIFDRGLDISELSISVIDKQGIFPIDLSRDRILNDSFITDDLIYEMCKYCIAYYLVCEYGSGGILGRNGFIPPNRSFIANIRTPVYIFSEYVSDCFIEEMKKKNMACLVNPQRFIPGYSSIDVEKWHSVLGEISNKTYELPKEFKEIWGSSNAIGSLKKHGSYLAFCKVHNQKIKNDFAIILPDEFIRGHGFITKYIP